jgi:gas vesicle protein
MDVKQKLKDWKIQAELLKMQMLLGKKETEIAFEEKKKETSQWLNGISEDIKSLQRAGQENLFSLKSKVEDLQMQLSLKEVDSLEQLKEHQKRLNNGLNEVKNELNNNIENGTESIKKWADVTEHKIDQYHSNFELFKLQLKMDGEEKFEEKRSEVVNKISDYKKSLENLESQTDLKWGNFKKEIGSAWDDVKKAF